MRHDVTQGVRGRTQDIELQPHPWALEPGAIRAHITVLHGEADTLASSSHAE